jgi:hypothetical protein
MKQVKLILMEGKMRRGNSYFAWSKRSSTLALLGAVFAAWALLGVTNTYAQVDTATILGTVTDSSGAVVPGANVTATNQLTGFSRSAKTSADGTYLIQFLPIGNNYRIQAEAFGFKTYVRTGIILEVGQNARADIPLELGQLTQKVQVTAAVPLVDTYSATNGETVEPMRLVELPLNGRSPLQLAATVPGATVVSVPIDLSGGNRGGGYINVNGSLQQSTDQQLDGIRFGGAVSNSALDYPNPDALAEFKLITNPLSAEYGMWAGGVFTAIVKAGTNTIHGNAFEFMRTGGLDARNFFAANSPPYHQNQFGANAGGPFIRNRLFWFGSYQGLRIRSYAYDSSIPLTADERAGLVTSSTPVINPLTHSAFPQNAAGQYVVSPLDPVAQAVLNKFIPVGTGSTVITQGTGPNDADQGVAKINYTISDRDQLSGMVFAEVVRAVDPLPTGPFPGYGSYTETGPQSSLSFVETHTFSPSLINEFRFGFSGQQETRVEVDGTSPADLGPGIQGWNYNNYSGTRPIDSPYIAVAGRFSIGDLGFNNWVEGGRNWQITDIVTKVKGKHNMKMGFDLYRREHHLDVHLCDTGCFGFDGTVTGNPTADFLLGALGSVERIWYTYDVGYISWSKMFFFQDDWKVSHNLTLNLGLRYELQVPYREYRAQSQLGAPGVGTWDLSAYEAGTQSKEFPLAPPGLVYPGDITPDYPGGVPATLIPTDKTLIEPRVGLAWDPFGNGRTSVRASFGVFSDVGLVRSVSYANCNLPFIDIDVTPDPPGALSNPYVGLTPFPNLSNPATNIRTDPAYFQTPSDASGWPKGYKRPRIMGITFSVERQLAPHLMLEVGYVGKLSHHLEDLVDINPAVYIPGTNPTTGQPYSTAANVNQRRIMTKDLGQLNAIGEFESGGNATFNSLQSTLRYEFAHGLTLMNAYTWSHSIDVVSCTFSAVGGCLAGQDPYNLNGSKGSSDYDLRHVDELSLVYDIPSPYRGPSPLKKLVKDWEVSALMRAATGLPFTILDGYDASLTGYAAPLGGTQGRPDLVGNPFLPGDRSRGQKIQEWFNPAALQINQPGTYGNLGRNNLYGPGFFNTDFGIFRNIVFSEHTKLQFRAEFFNLFNNVNFGSPNNLMLSPALGQISSAADGRIVQFGLKLFW